MVVISDHGEGFAVGNTGHTHLSPETIHVPWIVSIPGEEARAVDAVVATRAVFPTLFDVLGIGGLDRRALLGRGVDFDGADAGSALTFHGSMTAAVLTLPDVMIRFDVERGPAEIRFAPVDLRDHAGNTVPDWPSRLDQVPWRRALDRGVTGIFADAPAQSSR